MKLNLGCGRDNWKDGYINCDIIEPYDQYIDLTSYPWPFETDSADAIHMNHVLEHMPDAWKTMSEICRVLKKGGQFTGQVPYAYSNCAFIHPQHYHYYLDKSFEIYSRYFPIRVVKVELINFHVSVGNRIRNLIPRPIRYALRYFVPNMFDIVEFKMERI